MIETFRDNDTMKLYQGRRVRRFEGIKEQAERRLQILDSAKEIGDLGGLPSNHLESLSGDRRGQYSIRINRKWRICFVWRKDCAHDVEITDYH